MPPPEASPVWSVTSAAVISELALCPVMDPLEAVMLTVSPMFSNFGSS